MKNVSRLEQIGLDHRGSKKVSINGTFKNLDQMQPHVDLLHVFEKEKAPGQSAVDLKMLSKQRAQQLPLGGFLGERTAKTMALHGNSSSPTIKT